MINKLVLGVVLVLFSSNINLSPANAQAEEPYDNKIEKYNDLTDNEPENNSSMSEETVSSETESSDEIVEPNYRAREVLEETQSDDYSANYDVRQTEAFNLVSSAYRGEFEEQGINSYAILVSNYETGELTAEDLINAAIDSGELSPAAMEDDSYIDAVSRQLESLTRR